MQARGGFAKANSPDESYASKRQRLLLDLRTLFPILRIEKGLESTEDTIKKTVPHGTVFFMARPNQPQLNRKEKWQKALILLRFWHILFFFDFVILVKQKVSSI